LVPEACSNMCEDYRMWLLAIEEHV
jgi:hypothetical protein